VILGVGFCPHPPALVPELGFGITAEMDELRVACRSVVRSVAASSPDQWVLIGAGSVSASYGPLAHGTLKPYGRPAEYSLGADGCSSDKHLPLSLTVGAWLLADVLGPRTGAVAFSVGADFGSSRAAAALRGLAESRSVGLLVLGDGSARRTERAPGYFDPRAQDFDAQVLSALQSGDGAALAALDPVLGADLLAAGTPTWQIAGRLVSGVEHDSEVVYSGDPFGVAYFAAYWLPRG
jgi:hypothetical protein